MKNLFQFNFTWQHVFIIFQVVLWEHKCPPKTHDASPTDFFKSLTNIFATTLIPLFSWMQLQVDQLLYTNRQRYFWYSSCFSYTNNKYFLTSLNYLLPIKYIRLQIHLRLKYMKCFLRSYYINKSDFSRTNSVQIYLFSNWIIPH